MGDRGRGGRGQGPTARPRAPPQPRLQQRRRLLRRGGAAAVDRPVRRECRRRPELDLCRRSLGSHLAGPRIAEGRAGRPARRPVALCQRQGLAQADRPYRYRRRPLADPAHHAQQVDQLPGLARRRRRQPRRAERHDRLHRRLDRAADRDSRSGPRRRRPGGGAGRDQYLRGQDRPRGLGRHGRGAAVQRTRGGHAGRLRSGARCLQSCHPGRAPARLDDQALRLCDRARLRHDPGDDGRRPDLLRRPGQRPEVLPQLRFARLGRDSHDALGPGAVAQPDDRAYRQRGRDGPRGPDHRAGRHRQVQAVLFLRARRGRDHGAADGQCLCGARQQRHPV